MAEYRNGDEVMHNDLVYVAVNGRWMPSSQAPKGPGHYVIAAQGRSWVCEANGCRREQVSELPPITSDTPGAAKSLSKAAVAGIWGAAILAALLLIAAVQLLT